MQSNKTRPRSNVLDFVGLFLVASYLVVSAMSLYNDTPSGMANRTLDAYRSVDHANGSLIR